MSSSDLLILAGMVWLCSQIIRNKPGFCALGDQFADYPGRAERELKSDIEFVLHKGGDAPKVEKQKEPPPPPPLPPPPPPPKPPEPLPPPPTQSGNDIKQAELDQKRQAKRRRGYNATILAGEGGTAGTSSETGKKTILG